jgi:hypothetical protein
MSSTRPLAASQNKHPTIPSRRLPSVLFFHTAYNHVTIIAGFMVASLFSRRKLRFVYLPYTRDFECRDMTNQKSDREAATPGDANSQTRNPRKSNAREDTAALL